MLDDANVLKQRDPEGALGVAAGEWEQVNFDAQIVNPDHDGREISQVVVTGMGGSVLAALVVNEWLKEELAVPLEVVRNYNLPAYVGKNTLVIVTSCSGNTEETLSALDTALDRGAQVAIATSGGKLLERAKEGNTTHVVLPDRKLVEPRMTVIAQMRALIALLAHFGVSSGDHYDEIANTAEWLHGQTQNWEANVPTEKNPAKQLALESVGKTPVFYGGRLTGPLAYKWKISWNENAKNIAFWNVYPEMNHNEFIGWSSHPVEKPFVVFDLIGSFEHPRILKRFEISDKLLSGKRPKAKRIELVGDTPLKQMLYACVFADFASIYVAILNGVDPTPVDLVEKLKKELA